MMGLIKKDLCMIKNNYKSIILAFAIYIFYSIQFEMNMFFLLPFMGLMICISIMSYDDFNNWHAYASSLPQGKSGVVKSKYITTTGITTILSAIGLIIEIVLGSSNSNFILKETVENCLGIFTTMLLVMSVIYPILFKFGAEKGRIVMISLILVIYGIVLLATKVINLELSKNFISFLDSYFLIIITVFTFILIFISYFISKKIYLKKEF